ncbi:hypothetical protein, partial [Streptococcus suis]|uniref:hypothetical protein n=1 Tax=Streptococcus suis TaxID=1307 RepID=UPI001EDEDF65
CFIEAHKREKSLLTVAIFLFEGVKSYDGEGITNYGNDSWYSRHTHEENACKHFLITCIFLIYFHSFFHLVMSDSSN